MDTAQKPLTVTDANYPATAGNSGDERRLISDVTPRPAQPALAPCRHCCWSNWPVAVNRARSLNLLSPCPRPVAVELLAPGDVTLLLNRLAHFLCELQVAVQVMDVKHGAENFAGLFRWCR